MSTAIRPPNMPCSRCRGSQLTLNGHLCKRSLQVGPCYSSVTWLYRTEGHLRPFPAVSVSEGVWSVINAQTLCHVDDTLGD